MCDLLSAVVVPACVDGLGHQLGEAEVVRDTWGMSLREDRHVGESGLGERAAVLALCRPRRRVRDGDRVVIVDLSQARLQDATAILEGLVLAGARLRDAARVGPPFLWPSRTRGRMWRVLAMVP